MKIWKPEVKDGPAPLYERIADAIERDVKDGRIDAGSRLPPHRDLAHALSVSIGTVTRAYGEAERRGLLSGHVGRGSFVSPGAGDAGPPALPDAPVSLALNVPPPCSAPAYLAEALTRLRRRPDIAGAARYSPPEGLDTVRWAGADWMRRRHGLERVSADQLIQTNGGQHALALIFGAVCRPGETILCEAATFHGMKSLADMAGYRLCGVALDEEGLVPAALDEAAAASGARVLYTIPTLQNPTTSIAGATRRAAIAAIAQRRDLLIVEDDAYRCFARLEDLPPAFGDLVPERTFYVASLSKSLAPGLRLGFVRPPMARWREALLRAVRATGYAPPALGGLIFSQWLEEGTAERLAGEIADEARRRTDMARAVLGERLAAVRSGRSLHVWLPMSPLAAERTAGRALRAGVEVTPPDAPIVAADKIAGLRICLGGASDLPTLERSLAVIARVMEAEITDPARSIV
jgi:DNA-binding transcriptional MocR family regulator